MGSGCVPGASGRWASSGTVVPCATAAATASVLPVASSVEKEAGSVLCATPTGGGLDAGRMPCAMPMGGRGHRLEVCHVPCLQI